MYLKNVTNLLDVMGGYVNGKTVFVTKILATKWTNKDLIVIETMHFQMGFVIGGLSKAFGTMLTLVTASW